jgi:hypothetical protein
MSRLSVLPLLLIAGHGPGEGVWPVGDTGIVVSDPWGEPAGVVEADPNWGELPEETFDDVAEQADYLRSHPYDLNSVSQEELESIPGVQPEDGRKIIELRRRLKRFESPLQLLQLEDGGERVYHRVAPSVIVRGNSASAKVRTRLLTKAEEPGGELQPPDLLQQLALRGGDELSVEGLYHRSPQERPGEGFLSASLSLFSRTLRTSVLIGDYVVESGQGLVYWRSRSSGKGVRPVEGVRRVGRGVLPYHSVSESGFHRGVAVSTTPDPNGRVAALLFVSRRTQGFTINGIKSARDGTGSTRGSERLVGGVIRWSAMEDLLVTLSGGRTWFDHPLLLERSRVETLRAVTLLGASLLAGGNGLQAFSEFALSEPGSRAVVAGIRWTSLRPLACVILWRDYRPEFLSPYGGGFGETVTTRNEQGFYFGWQIEQGGRFSIEGSLDQYRLPSTHGSVNVHLGGRSMIVRCGLKCSESIRVSVRVVRRASDWSKLAAGDAGVSTSDRQMRVGCTLEVAPFRGGRFATTVESAAHQNGGGAPQSPGVLLTEEVHCRLWSGMECRASLTHHDLPGGSSVPEVEGDISGLLSRSVLEGRGRRWSLALHWAPIGWGSMSVNVSGYGDVRGITRSSGRAEIVERQNTAVIVQAEFAF